VDFEFYLDLFVNEATLCEAVLIFCCIRPLIEKEAI
jgi:hypothetical protein